MKTFLICPIRNATNDEVKFCESVVIDLEKDGYVVHWPYRDTDQEDCTGLRICADNYHAIKNADVVHIVYRSDSTGSHFDLGMAFALGKKIIPVVLPEFDKTKKSFPNMIYEWSQCV